MKKKRGSGSSRIKYSIVIPLAPDRKAEVVKHLDKQMVISKKEYEIIIIPGLIFGISIWELYYLTLLTSITLIWASRKKALPTLVGFNTMWAWLSLMVLAQHWIK